MQVRYDGEGGISQVSTSDFPDADNIPQKVPYITFVIPVETEDENEYWARNIKDDLSPLGTTELAPRLYPDSEGKDKQSVLVNITSASKVIRAINYFLSLCPRDGNEDLFTHLEEYRDKCEAIQFAKAKKPPLKSKLFSLFKQTKFKLTQGSNPISMVAGKNSLYVHKENSDGRSISEMEAFSAMGFRLLLNDRHPKVRCVHDEDGRRKGVVSKFIQNFTSIRDYFKQNGPLSFQKLCNSEIIKVWVAAYTEEETDLHTGNYGFNEDGFACKYDDDRANWPLSSKYFNVDPEKGELIANNSYTTPPLHDFPLSANAIKAFPKLYGSANPYHWHDRKGNEKFFSQPDLETLYKDPKFIADKYHSFLKRALIPRSAYESAALATIASANTRKKVVDHKCMRTQLLREELLKVDEFQEYLKNTPDALKKILDEFAEYNKSYKKTDDSYLHVDLDEVSKSFAELTKDLVIEKENVLEEFQFPEQVSEKTKKLIELKEFIQEIKPSLTQGRTHDTSRVNPSLPEFVYQLIETIQKNTGEKRNTGDRLFRYHVKNKDLAEQRNEIANHLCNELEKLMPKYMDDINDNSLTLNDALFKLEKQMLHLLRQAEKVNNKARDLLGTWKDGAGSLDACIKNGIKTMESFHQKMDLRAKK